MNNNILINVFRSLPIIGIIMCIVLISKILVNKKNLLTDDNSTPKEKINRTQNRGMLVSLISAILLNIVGGIMTKMNVPNSMILVNYGFIFGPVVGYLLDIGIGTDIGLSQFKNSKLNWFKYVLSNLISGKFLRYIVTVLLDLFISSPLQELLNKVIAPVTLKMKSMGAYTQLASKNMPSMLQSIVGFITFNAYTNQTRFNWAYPGDLPDKYVINSKVMLLVTSMAAVMFAIFNKNSADLSKQLIYTMIGIGLAFGLNYFGLDKQKEVDKKEVDKKEIKINNLKSSLGLIVFIMFFIYGIVLPFMNKK